MGLMFRLLGALVRTFFKTVFTAIAFGAVAGAITLGVAYQQTSQWPPKALADAAAIAIGLLTAYAAGLTVVVREAMKGVETVERDVQRGVQEVETAGKR